jgi:hypothetical protein
LPTPPFATSLFQVLILCSTTHFITLHCVILFLLI